MATLQHRPAVFDHVASDDDAHHRRHPPPAIPPSPTLSNPDLILPENDGERESQTPSPPFNLPSLSHLQAFYGTGGTGPVQGGYASGFAKNQNLSDQSMMAPIGVAYSLTSGGGNRAPKKNLFPRHAHSAHRLSDIGEEEGPLPPPRRSSSRLGRFPVNAPPMGQDWRGLTNSPASRNQTVGENGSHNNDSKDASSRSSSSNSTVSGNGDASQKQQQQSEAQKEETTSSGKGNMLHMGVNDNPNHNTHERGPANPVSGSGDELSSAILSNEAERILDNAKKRLTVCINPNS